MNDYFNLRGLGYVALAMVALAFGAAFFLGRCTSDIGLRVNVELTRRDGGAP